MPRASPLPPRLSKETFYEVCGHLTAFIIIVIIDITPSTGLRNVSMVSTENYGILKQEICHLMYNDWSAKPRNIEQSMVRYCELSSLVLSKNWDNVIKRIEKLSF